MLGRSVSGFAERFQQLPDRAMRRGEREAYFQSVSRLPVKLASSGGAVAAVLRDTLSGTRPCNGVRGNGAATWSGDRAVAPCHVLTERWQQSTCTSPRAFAR